MNSSKEIKLGAILSYVQMGAGAIITLIYTPLMIKTLGSSEYGLYNTVSSTVSMLNILNFGFSSSYIRYYAKYKKNHDREGIEKLNGLFLIIFSLIGLVALLCGTYLSFNLHYVFDNGLSIAEYEIAKKLMLILSLSLSISFPMSVFTNIIVSQEKFVFQKSLSIFKTVFSPLLTIPLLLNGYGSISIVAVTLTVSVIVDCVCLFYCFRRLFIKFRFHNFEKGLFKDIFVFSSFLAINIVVNHINLNIDNVLLGRFKGTQMVAIYAVGQTIYTYFQLFSTSISSLFTPRVHSLVNNYCGSEQKEKLTNLFVKVGRIQYLILALLCTGIIFFGKSFILNFWAGEGYDDSYYVLLLLVIPSIVPLTQNIGIEIQRAENKHKYRSIVYLFMAIVNLLCSIVLCQKYGAVGCAIGTSFSLLLANGLIMNIYYHKQCGINIFKYWKSIIGMSKGLIAPIILGTLIICFIDMSRFVVFAAFVILYVVIFSISMWIFALDQYEKNLFIKLTEKFKIKHRR